MKSCQQDISTTIEARGLTLGQLIGNNKYSIRLMFEQIPSNFSGIMTLCNIGHFKLVSKISRKRFQNMGLKLGHLIGDDLSKVWTKSVKFVRSYGGPLQTWAFQTCQQDFSKKCFS